MKFFITPDFCGNEYQQTLYQWVDKLSTLFKPSSREVNKSGQVDCFVLNGNKVREAMTSMLYNPSTPRTTNKQPKEKNNNLVNGNPVNVNCLSEYTHDTSKTVLYLNSLFIKWLDQLSISYENVINSENTDIFFPCHNDLGVDSDEIDVFLKALTLSFMQLLFDNELFDSQEYSLSLEEMFKSPDLINELICGNVYARPGLKYSLSAFLKFYEKRLATSIELDYLNINHFMNTHYVPSTESDDYKIWQSLLGEGNNKICQYHMLQSRDLFNDDEYHCLHTNAFEDLSKNEYLIQIFSMKNDINKRTRTFSGFVSHSGAGFNSSEVAYFSHLGFIEDNYQLIRCVYCNNGLYKASEGLFPEEVIKKCHKKNCKSLEIMETLEAMNKSETVYNIKRINDLQKLLNIL